MQEECNQNLACSQVYVSEHAVTKPLLGRGGKCLSLDERQYNMASLSKFEMDNISPVSVNYLYEMKEQWRTDHLQVSSSKPLHGLKLRLIWNV